MIQLAVDRRVLDALMAFGAEDAGREDGGNEEPPELPPMHACWLDAA